MNTQNDKATPRPWLINGTEPQQCGQWAVTTESSKRVGNIADVWGHDNAALIVRAVNEHSALNAIAEAASWLLDEFRSRTALIETCDLDPDEEAAMNKTEQALSTLQKLREGKE